MLEDPERFYNEVINAANMAGGEIWIEKIKVKTRPPKVHETPALTNDAISTLLACTDFQHLPDDFKEEFLSHMKAVQNRLSTYMKREDTVRIETDEDLEKLVEEARDMLVEKLVKGGGNH